MKYALIIGILCATLMFGACAGRSGADEVQTASAQLENEISPNARVEWRVFCMKCRHTFVYFDASKVTGLTKEELARWYPEWHIAAFSREYTRLTRSVDKYCPDHFLLYLDGGVISVRTPVSPELDEKELVSFDAGPYIFDGSELDLLNEGVSFDSLVEADRYLSEHKKRAAE